MIDFPLSNFSPIEPKPLKQNQPFEGGAKSRPLDGDPTGLGLGNTVEKNREKVAKGRYPVGVSDIAHGDGGSSSSKGNSTRGVKVNRVPSGQRGDVESWSSTAQPPTHNASVSSVSKVTSTSSPSVVVVSNGCGVGEDAGEVAEHGGNHGAVSSTGLQTNMGESLVTDNVTDLASMSVTPMAFALTIVTDKSFEQSTNIAGQCGSVVSSDDITLGQRSVLGMPSCGDTPPSGVGDDVCHPMSPTSHGQAEGRVQRHTNIVSRLLVHVTTVCLMTTCCEHVLCGSLFLCVDCFITKPFGFVFSSSVVGTLQYSCGTFTVPLLAL